MDRIPGCHRPFLREAGRLFHHVEISRPLRFNAPPFYLMKKLILAALGFQFLLIGSFSALNAQDTLQERTDLLLDSLSTRKVNTGQHDGPHRAGRTGFWTTEGRLERGNDGLDDLELSQRGDR